MKLTLKIWRQPGPHAAGHFDTHVIAEISDEASFLEMLDILNERLIDEGKEAVVFDHDCREGICGTCGMVINGAAHGPRRATTACHSSPPIARTSSWDSSSNVACAPASRVTSANGTITISPSVTRSAT